MGLFDAGKNNCSESGKGFNDFLSVLSLGMMGGPSDDECEAWKNKQNKKAEVAKDDQKDITTKIKEFLEKYKMEIGIIIIIIIIMKL